MPSIWAQRLRRGFRRSPRELFHRVIGETSAQFDRFRDDPLGSNPIETLLNNCGAPDIATLWDALAFRPYPAQTEPVADETIDALCSEAERQRVLTAANAVLNAKINLTGIGSHSLNGAIQWHMDPRTGTSWPEAYYRDIDLLDLGNPTDVRSVWELSRLQWLIPAGQAYLVTQDERYAEFARDVIESWIESNPYRRGVNWGVAMEAGMRVFTWSWFFHAFSGSVAWSSEPFRALFLCTLYRHGFFLENNLEAWGINGNHLVADGAGLCVLGQFFGGEKEPSRWSEIGWEILSREIQAQVLSDGVSFEAAMGYHRLTAELFYIAAAFRLALGEAVSESYRRKLAAMVEFTVAATRPDGTVPQWGDSDDGRVLPFGDQSIHDYRYLRSFVSALDDEAMPINVQAGVIAEAAWALGIDKVTKSLAGPEPCSTSFSEGGLYIMAKGGDHVFIDCGSVGYAGLGGHGHNDCLSFDAVLDGVSLISDGGTFAYSSSPEERNRFRGTAIHNTPMIDGEEQNRFVAQEELWRLRNDATPRVRRWEVGDRVDIFEGSHDGYLRLSEPVVPVRTIMLEKVEHRLLVIDRFTGTGNHKFSVPFHLAPNTKIIVEEEGRWCLEIGGRRFALLVLDVGQWAPNLGEGWVSPCYGVKQSRPLIEFSRDGAAQKLSVAIGPWEDNDGEGLFSWASRMCGELPTLDLD
ncbi:MAG: alginate lyase family protein [Proteobacteria bacterium]|nr:alginate lyase family protein [Pseudomonadota bacterium]